MFYEQAKAKLGNSIKDTVAASDEQRISRDTKIRYTFCLATINTATAEPFGEEYKFKLNQR